LTEFTAERTAEEINAAAADMAREIEAFHRGAQKDKRFLRPPKSERPECGAMTRTGRPCRARVVWNTGEREPKTRCRKHGGLSTGPKTPSGLKRAAMNLPKRT
jgi:hypothetical protein